MRKLTKILTILLAMAMLFGISAVFASAADSDGDNQLISEYATTAGYEDFEEIKEGVFSLTSSGTSTFKLGGFSGQPNLLTASIKSQSNNTDTNKYLNIAYNMPDYDKQVYNNMHFGTSSQNTSVYDFWIWDMDFCAMECFYTLNGIELRGSEIPEGAENVKLAYKSGMQINTVIRGTGAPTVAVKTGYDKATNTWYLSKDGSTTSDKAVKLSNTLGEWNHLTVVTYINRANPAKSSVAFYCNGEYIPDTETNFDGSQSIYAEGLRIWYNQSGTSSYHNFSIDNISSTYYAKGYSSIDYYGIDDYYADPETKKQEKISIAQDIVYNEDYEYVGTANFAAAILEFADGTTKNVAAMSKAISYFTNDMVVKLNSALSNYTPDPDKIQSITFKILREEARVSLSNEARELYKLYQVGDTYTVKLKAAEDGMKIKWLKEAGSEEVFTENYLLPFAQPYADKFDNYNVVDMQKGTITVIDSWTWSIPGTEFDGKPACALTSSQIKTLKEVNGLTSLTLVPNYRVINAVYTITTTETVGEGEEQTEVIKLYISSDYDYNKFTDVTKIPIALAKAPSGATLTFFGDGVTPIKIPADVGSFNNGAGNVLNVNLNGQTIVHNSDNLGSAYGPALFLVTEGSTFNIYGGKIFQAKAYATKDKTFNQAYGNAAIVSVSEGVNEATVNFGKDGKGNVNPIDFNGGTLVYVHGVSSPKDAPYLNLNLRDSKKIKINLEGGNHYLGIKPAYSMFAVAAPDVEISINNAAIYIGTTLDATSTNPSTVFTEYPGSGSNVYYTAGMKVNATNSKFVCKSLNNSDYYSLFYRSTSTTKAYFENCEIIAQTYYQNDNSAKITLGKGNVIAGDMAKYIGGNVNFAAGVNYAVNNNEAMLLKVNVSYPDKFVIGVITSAAPELPDNVYEYAVDVEKSGIISLSTFEGENTNADIAKVIWYKQDKETEYLVKYIYVGSKITDSMNPSSEGFEAYDPNNGWYYLAYGNSWNNITEGQGADPMVVVAGDNKLVPALEKAVIKLNVKTNVEFFTNIAYNIYLPKYNAESGITFEGFFINGEAQEFGEKDDMICMKSFLAADQFVSDTVTIKFKVAYDFNGNGEIEENEITELEKSVTFNLLSYAEAIASEFDCGSAEATLALALMQYKYEAYKAAAAEALDQDIVRSIERILLGHGKICACAANLKNFDASVFKAEELAITEESYVALKDYVTDFEYIVSSKNDSLDIDHLAMVIKVADGSVINGISAVLSANPEATVTFEKVSDNEYRLSGITVADIDSIFTITVSTADGDVVGQYCLAEYIELNSENILSKALYIISNYANEE